MRLTETRLRTLIRDILLEGYKDDLKNLEPKFRSDPETYEKVKALPPDWVSWLSNRYLRQVYPHSVELQTLMPRFLEFYERYKVILQTYKDSASFRGAVDALRDSVQTEAGNTETWKSPAEFKTMSPTSMHEILGLLQQHRDNGLVDRRSVEWKKDKVGQFGPWALYFPTTQASSINIAGADPKTLEAYTSWCSTRTGGSNMFYHYVGGGLMLFYAIDESKTPTDPESRISLGFYDGELTADGDYSEVTLDAKSRGLTMPDLERIFGGHLGPILSAAESVIKSHGGVHPAMAEIEAAATDPVKFAKVLHSLSSTEAADFGCEILQTQPSDEVAEAAARHKSEGVRSCATRWVKNPDTLAKLAGDSNFNVRYQVIRNKRTPRSVLQAMAQNDPDPSLRSDAAEILAQRPHVSESRRLARRIIAELKRR